MKPMKPSQNRNGAARILAKIAMDFKSPLRLKPPFFSTLTREFCYAVAKKETCSFDPCLDFRLSFLRARCLRFFFLDLFLNGKFPHRILCRSI